MSGTRITSKRYEGVSYRESKTRKFKGKPDRTYSYTLRDGEKKYIKAGRASEGMTEELAYQLRIEALGKIHNGENVDSLKKKKTQTLDRIMDAYLAWRKAEGKYPVQEKCRYDKHLKPMFGAIPVQQITLDRLDKFKAEKMATLAPSSVKKLFILARAAINFAISRKLYKGINPFEKRAGFAMPQEKNNSERALTVEESHRLLDELEKRSMQLRDMAFVSLFSGMRATEIFGLKGADIDEQNSLAIITAKGGDREVVHLRPQVLDVLKKYCTAPGALLFADGNGNRYKQTPRTFSRAVDALGLNDGVDDSTRKVIFHTLRHTYASRLAQSGMVTLIELKEAMRHRRIETTLRYAHLIPGEQHKKLALLDGFMPG